MQGHFTQIDHKFLVQGHTYLPNDQDFAHIEKGKVVLWCMFLKVGKKSLKVLVIKSYTIDCLSFFDFTSIQ